MYVKLQTAVRIYREYTFVLGDKCLNDDLFAGNFEKGFQRSIFFIVLIYRTLEQNAVLFSLCSYRDK